MKSLLLVFLLVLSQSLIYAQNPIGIYLDIDGQIKFWEMEANRIGYIKDTVIITCNSQTQTDDLGNLKYDHLTFLEAPRNISTMPSDADPSRINDSLPKINHDKMYEAGLVLPTWYSYYLQFYEDSLSMTHDTILTTPPSKFENKIRGAGLNDSIIHSIQLKLLDYVHQHWGKKETYQDRNKLYLDLSMYDTVIDKKAVYDYLVDLAIFYSYENNLLTSITGYHWNLGVEFDSLAYDDQGNLIYFSRESIGSIRDQFLFEYNAQGQVIKATCYYSGLINELEEELVRDYNISTYTFTYNKNGKIRSKSTLQNDGSWYTCYYKM